jgi:4-amino-4-deoxy-L-arabinose transferase-like glycosyltransferase
MKPSNRRLEHRVSFLLCLAGILLFFIAINARWLWVFRHGQPLDIDEAGYLGISMIDYYGFARDGIRGFLAAVEAPSIQAPLTPALAAMLYFITGPHVIVGFAVPLLAGTGSIIASYFLGSALGTRYVGLLSAVLVAACPTIIMYSRSFLFALPATFVTTMALLALLRSDRFRHFGWASVFGVCCGLMPLARTMTIAFVPAILLGAAVYAIAEPSGRRRRSLTLVWALLLALGTAATWLGPNGSVVFHYLQSFGYGNHAAGYGPAQSLFGFADWFLTAQSFSFYVHLPYFLFMLAGVLSLAFITGRHITRNGAGATLRVFARARVLPIIIYVAGATAALASSQNKGNGFFTPIVPAAIILAVWACSQVSGVRLYRSVVIAVATLVVILGIIPALDVSLRIARPWSIVVPLLGPAVVTDGRAYIQLYELSGGFISNNPNEPIGPVAGRMWVDFSADTATTIEQMRGTPPIAFGFRHYLYNVNTVGLQELIRKGTMTSLLQVDPVVTGDSVAGDVAWLTRGDAAQACVLLTSDATTGQIQPVVSNDRMVDAARGAGFRSVARWAMPNGQYVTVWNRKSTNPNC